MLFPLRLVLRLVSLVVTGLLVYLGITAYQVWSASRRDQAGAADAIVVLGAAQYNGRPSPDLSARLDHALDLWHRQLAPLMVVTGGRQPGDSFTEAAVSATYVEQRGVPKSAVLAETAGTDSWQSLAAAASLLEQRRARTVLLVSDPFHDSRISAMATELGLTALVSPTKTSPIRGTAAVPYYAKETVEVAVGRVVGFSRLSGVSAEIRRVHGPPAGG